MSRIASAPISRASTTSRGSTVKSLRSTGSDVAAAGRFEIGHRPAEELLVGEHGEAAGAAVLVRRRQLGGVEVAVEVALGR